MHTSAVYQLQGFLPSYIRILCGQSTTRENIQIKVVTPTREVAAAAATVVIEVTVVMLEKVIVVLEIGLVREAAVIQ